MWFEYRSNSSAWLLGSRVLRLFLGSSLGVHCASFFGSWFLANSWIATRATRHELKLIVAFERIQLPSILKSFEWSTTCIRNKQEDYAYAKSFLLSFSQDVSCSVFAFLPRSSWMVRHQSEPLSLCAHGVHMYVTDIRMWASDIHTHAEVRNHKLFINEMHFVCIYDAW